jgi:hypothetical protein
MGSRAVDCPGLDKDIVAALAEHECVAKPTVSRDATPGELEFDIFSTEGELIVDALPLGDLWDFIETDVRCPDCGCRDVHDEEGFDVHGERVIWNECGDCEYCWQEDETT